MGVTDSLNGDHITNAKKGGGLSKKHERQRRRDDGPPHTLCVATEASETEQKEKNTIMTQTPNAIHGTAAVDVFVVRWCWWWWGIHILFSGAFFVFLYVCVCFFFGLSARLLPSSFHSFGFRLSCACVCVCVFSFLLLFSPFGCFSLLVFAQLLFLLFSVFLSFFSLLLLHDTVQGKYTYICICIYMHVYTTNETNPTHTNIVNIIHHIQTDRPTHGARKQVEEKRMRVGGGMWNGEAERASGIGRSTASLLA